MSGHKSITDILPVDCLYEIIQKFIHDLKTLNSCITVDRTFCQLIVPILWKNPFKLTNDQTRKALIIRTYFSCLDEEEKSVITKKFSKPTLEFPKPFINYPSYLQEFELFPIQQSMREFIRGNVQFTAKSTRSKKVRYVIRELNPLMMKLFINKQSNYKYVNIYLYDGLSLAKNQMDINILDDEIIEHVLLNINKFSFGFQCDVKNSEYYSFIQSNTTKLAKCIKNVQHLSISIKLQFLSKQETHTKHNEIIENLRTLVLSLNNLRSFSTVWIWKDNDYLDMFQKHSNSLTFLKLIDVSLCSIVFDILDQCPNLKTLELLSAYFSYPDNKNKPITSQLNYLENLSVTMPHYNNVSKIFERICLMSNNNIKTLFLNIIYMPFLNVKWQDYFTPLQPFLSNLSHFFFKRTNVNETVKLILLLETLKNLYHFKLGNQLNHLPFSISEIKGLSISLSPTLKILECDFQLTEDTLKTLLHDGEYNLTELSIYPTIDNDSLKIIIEYAKQRNSLSIFRYNIHSTLENNDLKEARNLFMIGKNPKFFETPFY